MVARFGDQYLRYRSKVPMFVPRWGSWRDLFDASNATEVRQ